jgi:hypothetical protein
MGTNGHNVSRTGQDRAVVHAAAGQMAQLDLRALWLSKNNNVRVYVDGDEDGTILQGTVLPPTEGGGRTFRSKVGGKIEVLQVTDVLTSLSFFDLEVRMVCADTSGCGGHGSCSYGNCTCSDGYHEMGTSSISSVKSVTVTHSRRRSLTYVHVRRPYGCAFVQDVSVPRGTRSIGQQQPA